MLEWHKFSKKTMPPEDYEQILVCRDVRHGPFFVVVTIVHGGKMLHGINEFTPEPSDRWTYVPYPDK